MCKLHSTQLEEIWKKLGQFPTPRNILSGEATQQAMIAYLTIYTNLDPLNQKISFVKCFQFGLVIPGQLLEIQNFLVAKPLYNQG